MDIDEICDARRRQFETATYIAKFVVLIELRLASRHASSSTTRDLVMLALCFFNEYQDPSVGLVELSVSELGRHQVTVGEASKSFDRDDGRRPQRSLRRVSSYIGGSTRRVYQLSLNTY